MATHNRRQCQYYYFVFLYQKSVFHTLKIRRFHNIVTVSCGFYKYRTVAYSLQHTCGKTVVCMYGPSRTTHSIFIAYSGRSSLKLATTM